jgi:RNA polymerase sigma-70 factor (ECF subfamily)
MATPLESAGLPWERYRDYLQLLARLQMPARLRAKLDASDVVQQTLLEAHREADRLAEMGESDRVAYLRKALEHNLIDQARYHDAKRRDARRERPLEDQLRESSARLEGWLEGVQSSPSQRAARQEDLLRLAGALARLAEDQRLAVEMKHLGGEPVSAIAEALGRSETAVSGLLRRGLKRLRELLDEGE